MPQVSSALRLQRLQACAPRRHDAQGLRRCVALLLLVAGLLLGLLPLAQAQQGKFLPPDEAFHAIAAVQGPKTLLLTFDIAKGYYLYQERFHFEAQTPGVTLGKPDYPPAHKKFDVNLGHEVYHYRNQVIVPLPVLAAPASFKLQLTYQGCSDEGLCYPPIDKIATVSLKGFGGTGTVSIADADEGGGAATGAATNAATGSSVTGLLGSLLGGKSGAASGAAAAAASAPAATASASVAASASASVPASPTSLPGPATAAAGSSSPAAAGAGAAVAAGGESSRIGSALASGSLLSIIPMFVLFGLLLAFTPCVLPMIPILSSIIVGQGERVSRGRGLALAVVYSLGMALV